MRVLVLVLLASLFSGHTVLPGEQVKGTYYYFCVSTPRNPSTGTQHSILFTDIKVITGDKTLIKQKTKDWGTEVEKYCQNPSGCTSDLNYYNTLKEAQAEFEKIEIRYFMDTINYRVKKLDF